MSFPTTHWSALAIATLNGDTTGRQALNALCGAYRGPVAAFLRSRGFGESEAEDLTQDFFLRLLESSAWKRADRARGRFRTFLLGTLVHVLGHARDRENAAKRGNGITAASLDELWVSGQGPVVADPKEAHSFDREWALRLVENALAAMERSFADAGRAGEWKVIERFLPGLEPPTYEEAAKELGVSLGAMKTMVHRVRQQFREELRAAVAPTVSAAHEIGDELSYLHRVLADRTG